MTYELGPKRFFLTIKTPDGKYHVEHWNGGGGPMTTDTHEWGEVHHWNQIPDRSLCSYEEVSKLAAQAAQGRGRGYGPPPKGVVEVYELTANLVSALNVKEILVKEALAKLTAEERDALGFK